MQQAITIYARNIEHTPDQPVLFMLDEMSVLGRLAMVEQANGLMTGLGMQLWGVVQDLSQLESIYDKGWETFTGNSGVLQYFGSRDRRIAEYFSKLCGLITLEKLSFNSVIARAFSSTNGLGVGSSTSGTTATCTVAREVVQRHFAYPDELMVMPDGTQIVLIENFNPIRARRLSWLDNEERRGLGINLRKPLATVINLVAPPAPARFPTVF